MSKLLVVDDDELTRTLMREELSDAGHEVLLAEDGAVGLDIVNRESVDLVVLDIVMPRLNGWDMLQRIRRGYSAAELPVIIVTTPKETREMVCAFDHGANDFIFKPIDFSVLVARIGTQLKLSALSKRKEEFFHIASHDLKNSLTCILSTAKIAQKNCEADRTGLGKEVKEMLGSIGESAREMYNTIVELLDCQALGNGHIVLKKNSCDLNEIVESLMNRHQKLADEKQIQFCFQPHSELAKVQADENRIRQVINNYLSNSLKFCPSKTEVTLRTRQQDGFVILEVSDNGPGLTNQDLDKVFTKYARLSNLPTGNEKSYGLGLALSKEMIELHGGHVGARNNASGGATFWFKLPI